MSKMGWRRGEGFEIFWPLLKILSAADHLTYTFACRIACLPHAYLLHNQAQLPVDIDSKVMKTNMHADVCSLAAEEIDESGVPEGGYVPTATGEHAPIPSPSAGYAATPGSGAVAGTASFGSSKTVFDASAETH